MTEIASAYVSLLVRMPGVKKDIERGLGASDVQGAVKSQGSTMGSVLAGAVGGAVVLGLQKAMTAVTSAVDGAIARVDTMNNFPKIMENLGYSSDEAAESIQSMSDRLTGLPTVLDSMAGMVQQLAPLTGSLADATDLSLALNNALLAGGKSTDIQANAMEQYTQMLAVGKVDMAAWRSMVSAMPGQMNQLSEALLGAGAGSMDLYEALKAGEVGFDDFNEAILKLNTEGTGAYASFAEQARSATEGIATGQANLGTAITRGLANLIAKFQPQITAILAGVTGFVNDAFKAVGGFIDWVGANKDWLTPLAIGVGVLAAGFVALNVASTIAAAGGIAKFLAATKVATAVQGAFNLVMNANPIMLVITAIAALVAGLIWFFTQTELGKEIWENVTKFIGDAVTWLWESILQPVFTAIGEIFTWIYENIIMPIVTAIMIYIGLWAAIITWLWENVIGPVFAAIGEIFTWLYENVIGPIIDGISLYFQALGIIFNWLYQNVVKPVFDAVAAAFKWVWQNVIKPTADFISNAIKTVGDTIHNVFSGIADFIGSAFQSVLGVVRGPINALIGLINGIIGGLNSIRVDIPDWVPVVGGQTFGLNIPKIPQLAEGGIVTASAGGTLAVVGEGGRDEAVLPLPEGWRNGGLGFQSGDKLTLVVEGTPLTAVVSRKLTEHDAARNRRVAQGWRRE